MSSYTSIITIIVYNQNSKRFAKKKKKYGNACKYEKAEKKRNMLIKWEFMLNFILIVDPAQIKDCISLLQYK